VKRNEKSIQDSVVGYARGEFAMLAIKLSIVGAFGVMGWPDFMFLFQGRVMFIEFKAPGAKSTPLQQLKQNTLRLAGFEVYEVDDAQVGKDLIATFAEAA
jgi:hypothetical protein